jgi:integrase
LLYPAELRALLRGETHFKTLLNFCFFIPYSYTAVRKENATMQNWAKTQIQCLVRHSSGIYYARARVKGKLTWKTLNTDVYPVAKARLPDILERLRRVSEAETSFEKGHATFAEAAEVYLLGYSRRVDLKPRTIDYQREVVAALLKSWPALAEAKFKSVTRSQCQLWASRYATEVSASRYNNTLSAFKAILELGVAAGVIMVNPVAGIDRVTPKQKKLELPNRPDFAAMVRELRAGGGGYSQPCADLVEFLAYSGARIGESREIKWADVDLAGGLLWIYGDPEHGTKNRSSRQIPIIEPLRRLLKDMRANPRGFRDSEREKGGFILAVQECQKAIDRACAKLGLKRITHHDLRHLFATACIESGVDIPTVSRWLGHRDGGALAMKTYGRLRSEHSLEMAKKVTF